MLLQIRRLGGHAHLVSMLHDLCEVLRIKSIDQIKKVLTRWTFGICKVIGEVLEEQLVLLELRPKFLDR